MLIKKNKIIILFLFLLLFCFSLISNSKTASAISFTPQVTIPGSDFQAGTSTEIENSTATIGKYIKSFYNYLIAIVGLVAAIVLMLAGVIWLTAGGNTEKIGQAKGLMMGSFTGIVLVLTSYIILKTINPGLVNFRDQGIDSIKAVYIDACCEYNNKAELMSSIECEKKNGALYIITKNESYAPNMSRNKCEKLVKYCHIKIGCDNEVEFCYLSDSATNNKQEDCGSFWSQKGITYKNAYNIKKGDCSQHQECQNKIAECAGLENGEKCKETSDGVTLDGYCYSSFCYIGAGIHGEPCGTKQGALCSNQKCSELGPNYYNEYINSNGRACLNDPLHYCCYKGVATDSECYGIQDGERCPKEGDCYCYKNKAYLGRGNLGEPCGNNGGKCVQCINGCSGYSTSKSCEELGYPKGRDNWGGRSCGTDLKCCIP